MTDPDVPDGHCRCSAVERAEWRGHSPRCVLVNRAIAHGTRLPAMLEQILVEIAADPTHHRFRRDRLDFGGDAAMRDTFMEALRSPGIRAWADQCDDDPQEVCVRAQGDHHEGVRWSEMAIMLLDPWWSSTAEESRALAEDVALRWEPLQAAMARVDRVRRGHATVEDQKVPWTEFAESIRERENA